MSDLLPELQSKAVFGKITVRDLLDMASGLAVPENYDPFRPLTGTAGMYLTRDIPSFVKDHAHLAFKPGSKGRYRSIDTEVLGLILARVEGKPLADLLSERIWKPMGAEVDATWNLDRPGGNEKAFCCIPPRAPRDRSGARRRHPDHSRALDRADRDAGPPRGGRLAIFRPMVARARRR